MLLLVAPLLLLLVLADSAAGGAAGLGCILRTRAPLCHHQSLEVFNRWPCC